MPLGNLTSQFFANIYLNELDQFIKRKLHTKYYIRYVDDFVILHNSKEQLEIWKVNIDNFLEENLKLKLHTEKSRIVLLKVGVDFVGFRIFPNHKLLRKRNIRNIFGKIKSYENNELTFTQIFNSYRGWRGYAQLANTYKLRAKIRVKIIEILLKKI